MVDKLKVITFKKHRAKWNTCIECDLSYARRKVVLARGFVPCDVLMLGEAPGQSEDVLGAPFVGPAGQLLDSAINLAMDVGDWTKPGVPIRVCLTNLIACIPKEITYSECGEYIDSVGKKTSDPPKWAIEACAERLQEMYRIARPKKLVCVGSIAEKWVPKVLDIVVEDTIAIVHPAAILRAKVASKGLAYQRMCVQLEDLFSELS